MIYIAQLQTSNHCQGAGTHSGDIRMPVCGGEMSTRGPF